MGRNEARNNPDFIRVEKAIRFLEANFTRQPSLADVAAHVHLSEYHFQRLFRRWAGISPKRFLQYLTAEHARRLLRESQSVLEASVASGLSGSGRLHDLLITLHAATPGDVKNQGADLQIAYGFHPSPFGEYILASTARGICAIEFIGPGGRGATLTRLKGHWPRANWRLQPRVTQTFAARLFTPLQARAGQFDLFVRGSNFQIKVWEALLRIPPGYVAAYQDIAVYLQAPATTRAAATAIASNPIAVLIPCHRVIRKSGAFGDYRWGETRKKAILGWEAAQTQDGANPRDI